MNRHIHRLSREICVRHPRDKHKYIAISLTSSALHITVHTYKPDDLVFLDEEIINIDDHPEVRAIHDGIGWDMAELLDLLTPLDEVVPKH